MENKQGSLMTKRMILAIQIIVVAALLFLISNIIFRGSSNTPRTSLERKYYDALDAVKLDPTNPKARLKLAMVYMESGSYNQAIKELNYAVQLDPKDPEIYYGIGIASHKIRNLDKATKALNRAVNLKGTFGEVYREAYYELGEIYYEKKKYEESIKAFEKARLQGSEYPYVLIALAKAYEKAGYIDKAITEYKDAVRYNPKDRKTSLEIERLEKKLTEGK